MIDMLAYVTDRDPVIGWEAVKPAGLASRPPEYLQKLGELDAAWVEYLHLADAIEDGFPVHEEFAAATRKVVNLQKEISRMYYLLNLRPLEVTPEVEIARSDAEEASIPFWAGME